MSDQTIPTEQQDSTAKHTPGPWTVEIQRSDTVESGYITGHITSPLHTYCGNTKERRDSITAPGSMTWSDAHLIAAAPDLKDALTWAVKWMEQYEGETMPEWREWAARGRAALDKAVAP